MAACAFKLPSPLRGLLAGLLALIVFASVAVAMAAGGSASVAGGLTPSLTGQAGRRGDR